MEKRPLYTVEELTENPSFIRWVNGDIEDPKEVEFWDQWVEANEHNRRIAKQVQQKLTGISFTKDSLPNIDQGWKQVRQNFGTEFESEASFRIRHSLLPDRKKYPLYTFLKVAAIILIVAGSFLFLATKFQWLNPNEKQNIQTLTTNYNEQKTITLSDGSKITLAAGSSLSHAKNWLQQPIMHVKLKGEAYFSIKHLNVKDHPKLVIKTADGTVSDWGTQFVVSTYGVGTRVVLQEGTVKIDVAGDTTQKLTRITPGELANFRKSNKKITIKHVNPLVYTSWTTNRLVFDHTPLSVLIKRIKHTYGVQVQVEDKDLLTKKLSGSVGSQSLDMLIRAVNQVLGIDITRKGNTVYIGNSK